MGWDKGKYYTRSRREGGRVVREYFGAGLLGRAAALLDAKQRTRREEERRRALEEKARVEALDLTVNDLDELTELVVRAAMAAAGFRRHNRGEWRKRRGEPTEGV